MFVWDDCKRQIRKLDHSNIVERWGQSRFNFELANKNNCSKLLKAFNEVVRDCFGATGKFTKNQNVIANILAKNIQNEIGSFIKEFMMIGKELFKTEKENEVKWKLFYEYNHLL